MSINFHTIRAENPLHLVVSRYVILTQRGGKYWGLCPFHDDRNPTNFNVYRGKDDVYRFRCFACGEHGDVIDFVATINGIDKAEAIKMLNGNDLPEVGTYVPKELPPDQTDAWEPIIPVPEGTPEYEPEHTFSASRGRFVNYRYCMDRLDPYYDAQGRLICWVVRLVYEDGHKICPTITWCNGPKGRKAWVNKRMKAPYPLQGLDRLAKFPELHVLLVSGEKVKAAVDSFCPEEFVAVSWLGGDDGYKKTDFTPLFGRKITYWPDADHSGRRAMNHAYKAIEKAGTG
jgi:hypothetical protein